MKVLVYFEQEYSIKSRLTIRTVENISKIFEASSKEDLLVQFHDLQYIPKYLKNMPNVIEVICGKKTMVWYLPETFKPHF